MKSVDAQKIVREGTKIYDLIKSKYLSEHTGEFLAIDIDSHDAFLATQSTDAIQDAIKAHPGKVFFLVKIGYSAVERFARLKNKRI